MDLYISSNAVSSAAKAIVCGGCGYIAGSLSSFPFTRLRVCISVAFYLLSLWYTSSIIGRNKQENTLLCETDFVKDILLLVPNGFHSFIKDDPSSPGCIKLDIGFTPPFVHFPQQVLEERRCKRNYSYVIGQFFNKNHIESTNPKIKETAKELNEGLIQNLYDYYKKHPTLVQQAVKSLKINFENELPNFYWKSSSERNLPEKLLGYFNEKKSFFESLKSSQKEIKYIIFLRLTKFFLEINNIKEFDYDNEKGYISNETYVSSSIEKFKKQNNEKKIAYEKMKNLFLEYTGIQHNEEKGTDWYQKIYQHLSLEYGFVEE